MTLQQELGWDEYARLAQAWLGDGEKRTRLRLDVDRLREFPLCHVEEWDR